MGKQGAPPPAGFGLRCGPCARRYGLDSGPDDFVVVTTESGFEVWRRPRRDHQVGWLRLDFEPRFPTSAKPRDLPQSPPSWCDHGHCFEWRLSTYVAAAETARRFGAHRGVILPNGDADFYLDDAGLVRGRPGGRRFPTKPAKTVAAQQQQVMGLLRSRNREVP